MKFSYNWLRELVPGLKTEPAELQRLITMKTAECEGIEPVGEHFASVIAARIVSTAPLPKGKNKLVVADIGGGKQINVVCGAETLNPVCSRPGFRQALNSARSLSAAPPSKVSPARACLPALPNSASAAITPACSNSIHPAPRRSIARRHTRFRH